jgi:hypothetical protein
MQGINEKGQCIRGEENQNSFITNNSLFKVSLANLKLQSYICLFNISFLKHEQGLMKRKWKIKTMNDWGDFFVFNTSISALHFNKPLYCLMMERVYLRKVINNEGIMCKINVKII